MTTGGKGGYSFDLPQCAKRYILSFEAEGFAPYTVEAIEVVPGTWVTQDAELVNSAVTEEITVTAIRHALIGALYVTSRLLSIPWLLAPEVSEDAASSAGRWVFAPELTAPFEAPIEDALAGVGVLLLPVAAEHGGSGAPIVSFVSKIGGQDASGSLRYESGNLAWRERTPYEREQGIERSGNDPSEVYQATLGGGDEIWGKPIWFFLAGRNEHLVRQETFPLTPLPNRSTLDDQYYEGKLTASLASNQTLSVFLAMGDRGFEGPSFPFSIGPSTAGQIDDGLRRAELDWSGAFNGSWAADLQAAYEEVRREPHHRNHGIEESPFLSSRFLLQYHRPWSDATDPEVRDRFRVAGNLSRFRSTELWGSHDVRVGVEERLEFREGGFSPSESGFVFDADPQRRPDGTLVLVQDEPVPLWRSRGPELTLLRDFRSARGLQLDTHKTSAYVRDLWNLDEHWTVNFGLRYERVSWDGSGEVLSLAADRLLPRLAVTYSPGTGRKFVVEVSYGEYALGFEEGLVAADNPLRTVPNSLYVYTGPDGEGIDFAPGLDPRNYRLLVESRPGRDVVADRDLGLPFARQMGVMARWQPVSALDFELSYIDRTYGDFLEDLVPPQGPVRIANSNDLSRHDRATTLTGRVRRTAWQAYGSWAWQLESDGQSGPVIPRQVFPTAFGDYPGIVDVGRAFPAGTLDDFREHVARLNVSGSRELGRGTLSGALLGRFDSGGAFSLIDTVPLGVPSEGSGLPLSQPVYFGARGAGRFKDSVRFDTAISYELPVSTILYVLPLPSGSRVWLQIDVANLFGEDSLRTFDTTVFADLAGPQDVAGLPTGFVPSPNFGRPLGRESFVEPRTVRASVAFRFGGD